MKNHIQFRTMQIADLNAVHRLESEIFPKPWALKSFRFEIERNLLSDPWVAFIEENTSTRIVGYIVPWMLVQEVHIANIAVDRAFRKLGIATRLLSGTLLHAKDLGVKIAILEVRASNIPAQKLYQSLDFEIVGRRKHYYQDNDEDALIMRRDGLPNKMHQDQLEIA